MRVRSISASGTATLVLLALTTVTAQAATDVGWFYNDADHDAKARFRAYGEHIDLCKLNKAKVFVEYGVAGGSISRTYYDGDVDSCKDINWAAAEGKAIQIRVCEQKTWAPDDCSAWKYGTA
ncbi:hypothetical protein [Nocardioides stalactiti]|uniref:hypothetical protein n=1 Tax=Nocardioides stalactiti TaxID=2755356 RepID=UPI00160145A7|nr:hypothetical protein [Nocardioides stalactiti]